jgi:hypothetical protein
LTARDDPKEHFAMWNWLSCQKYKKVIISAGNHDNFLQSKEGNHIIGNWNPAITYLCDSGTEFEYEEKISNPFSDDTLIFDFVSAPTIPSFNHVIKKFKIWGSPWTLRFKGMNPHCMAFTVDTEEELAEKWALIPDDVDILVTHSPPYCGPSYEGQNPTESYTKLDRVRRYGPFGHEREENVGSPSLSKKCNPDAGLILHVFGHIHEAYGHYHEMNPVFETHLVNASHVNERYEPINKPIRIEL